MKAEEKLMLVVGSNRYKIAVTTNNDQMIVIFEIDNDLISALISALVEFCAFLFNNQLQNSNTIDV